MSDFVTWLVQNITNIFSVLIHGLIQVVSVVVSGFFDIVIALANSLPVSHLTAPVVPSGSVWAALIRCLNFFFDIPGLIGIVGIAIAAHLALIVGVAVLRFCQVMD